LPIVDYVYEQHPSERPQSAPPRRYLPSRLYSPRRPTRDWFGPFDPDQETLQFPNMVASRPDEYFNLP
jgi:hypothetical protein